MIARAAPRIGDTEESFAAPHHGRIDKFIARLPLEEVDEFISDLLEKILRKIKLSLMKWDNLLSGHIKKIKRINGNGSVKENKPTLFDENKTEQSESKSESNQGW